MIRDLNKDYAVLQTGYWRIEIDLARPRFVSLRCATDGLGGYCQEMLEPGFGAESVAETKQGMIRSRDSIGHEVVRDEWRSLTIQKISLGGFALLDWKIMLPGDKGEILRVEITREIFGIKRFDQLFHLAPMKAEPIIYNFHNGFLQPRFIALSLWYDIKKRK